MDTSRSYLVGHVDLVRSKESNRRHSTNRNIISGNYIAQLINRPNSQIRTSPRVWGPPKMYFAPTESDGRYGAEGPRKKSECYIKYYTSLVNKFFAPGFPHMTPAWGFRTRATTEDNPNIIHLKAPMVAWREIVKLNSSILGKNIGRSTRGDFYSALVAKSQRHFERNMSGDRRFYPCSLVRRAASKILYFYAYLGR